MPREDFRLLRTPTRTVDHGQLVQSARDAAAMLNDLRDGKTNNVGEVTLTAGAATTTVTDFRVRAASAILLMPTTANAALALASADPAYVSSVLKHQFVVTHANNAQTDRSFLYVVIG